MEKEFVPYNLALRMKQLGFDEPCLAWYGSKDIFQINGKYKNSTHTIGYCVSAPTWQSAFGWFRENYPEINPAYNLLFILDRTSQTENPMTYEECELACLEKLIDIVEQEQK